MSNDTTGATDLMAPIQPHAALDEWLKGEGLDKALKAMNVSAVAKKPGHVVKRLGKTLGAHFSTPRVLVWEKGRKNVYSAATSKGIVSEVALAADGNIPAGEAVFQTDLYFRANKEVTEVNASTVSGITAKAIADLSDLPTDESLDVRMRVALTLARIFQTGLKDSGGDANEVRQYLVPNHDMAMVVLSLPIKRIEFDEELIGQVALVARVIPASGLSAEDQAQLVELKSALTKDGHPGAEAFAEMVAARSRPASSEYL